MSFTWEKLGLVFDPSKTKNHPKLLTHASNPVAMRLQGDVYRVFFSGRDANNRSSVGGVDVDLSTLRVIKNHFYPFAEFEEGSFYSHGVSIGCVFEIGADRRILFMGWHVPDGRHWEGKIGSLRVCEELGPVLKHTGDIFLDRNDIDPVSLSYPWVHKFKDGLYRMWYGTTKSWTSSNGEMIHTIDFADSWDGITWDRRGTAVNYELGVAQAFSRPTVFLHEDGNFYMWFSYRSGTGQSYRIGHAWSEDAIEWTCDLNGSGIDVSETGWDSEMIEYPFVFEHRNDIFMLYNGNSFGKTGFGIAKLQKD